jgi:L-lactate dehydrogenase complex protein LldE
MPFMKVGLFIPCYIDQFYPQVGIATLQLLEKSGTSVKFPLEQTCCGQPMANAGYEHYGKGSAELFVRNFSEFDYVVAPSGSCVMHVKEHLAHLTHADEAPQLQKRVYELCEFLTDVIKVKDLSAYFPHKVGIHPSCHGLRGLRLATASELTQPIFNKPRTLLEKVKGIQLAELSRADECCGFGGTFAVSEEAVSVRMGHDRLQDHINSGVEVITGADMSCLMHLEGLARRQKLNLKVLHIAEILNSES